MDRIDPICGMKGTIEAHGHFFCCQHCIRKYEEQEGIAGDAAYCPSCATAPPGTPWYKEKLYIITIFTTALLIVSYFVDELNLFYVAFMDYLWLIWLAVLIGFLIGGIIDYFIPRSYIEKYLSRHEKKTIVYAILFGFLLSACSHGILAIAMQLYKKGANTSSVIALLLASPWANLPITFLLFGFFGLKAFTIMLAALIIAAITGLIYQQLEKRGLVECNQCQLGEDRPVLENFSVWQDMRRRWRGYEPTRENNWNAFKGTMSGSWALTKMVMWWLVVGMLMAAAARAFIPTHYFMDYMGPTMFGLMVTLFFATIIEVCSEGSAPLAFEIFNQTGAFGNSFTFLMAGVATDYTEIGLIWNNIGKKAALWLPIITVPQVLAFGILFNIFL